MNGVGFRCQSVQFAEAVRRPAPRWRLVGRSPRRFQPFRFPKVPASSAIYPLLYIISLKYPRFVKFDVTSHGASANGPRCSWTKVDMSAEPWHQHLETEPVGRIQIRDEGVGFFGARVQPQAVDGEKRIGRCE